MIDKPKFPRAVALEVARELCQVIKPSTERLIVAGSLRRRKELVGDVEILFVQKFFNVPDGLFDTKHVSAVDMLLEDLQREGVIAKRRNVNGSEMWGEKNKLAVHVASGVPVDFFAASLGNWFNYLVCRTGPAESNTRIASRALDMGWHWNPYGEGFSRPGQSHRMESERAVFEFVGLPYAEPWERL